LDRMRESKQWQAARVMPKGKKGSARGKARNKAFRACIERFVFTETWVDRVAVAHKNAAGFRDRLGTHDTQRIGERAFDAVVQHLMGKRGRPRFKGKGRGLHSIESKRNNTGIRWQCDTGCVVWKDITMPVRLRAEGRDRY